MRKRLTGRIQLAKQSSKEATSSSNRPMANHNRSWIWGRHVVLETLTAGIWQPWEVVASDKCSATLWQQISELTAQREIPLQSVSDTQLAKLCRSEDHQGLAARMPEFPYRTDRPWLSKSGRLSSWILLDRIQDAFNLGAIIRSADGLGIAGVILGERGQAGVTSQVVRSSAGAINHLPIHRVPVLLEVVQEFQKAGGQAIAATEKSPLPIDAVVFQRPALLIVGNEGVGIAPELLDACQMHVSIPMQGKVGSLNVAVAASLLMYELQRRDRK